MENSSDSDDVKSDREGVRNVETISSKRVGNNESSSGNLTQSDKSSYGWVSGGTTSSRVQPDTPHPKGSAKNNNKDDYVTELLDSNIGNVGIKWRLRIMRVHDSAEQWDGIAEIYFHWNKSQDLPTSNEYGTRRRLSYSAPTKLADQPIKGRTTAEVIPTPSSHPMFMILNDEESHVTEEIYYKVSKFPNLLFGYIEFNVKVHERLELEVF